MKFIPIKIFILCYLFLFITSNTYAQVVKTNPPLHQQTSLYPIGKIFDSGQLQVNKNISIYYEQRGNPKGPAVVYNHGGPGGYSQAKHSQWFDPSYFRIIIYDQRGTGKSHPSIANKNTNSNLFKDITIETMISDLEKLRNHLNIPKWIVFGGSWGSTLTLAYAEKYPEKVRGIVVYGIFLNKPAEMDQYYQLEYMKHRFPLLGEKAFKILSDYANSKNLKIKDSQSFINAYYTLCVSKDDPKAQYLWTQYENFNDDPTTDSLNALSKSVNKNTLDSSDRTHAVFETSIFRYAYKDFDILNPFSLAKLKKMNVHIIQGLNDTEAPPIFAKQLVSALSKIKPDLHYKFIKEGRHDGTSSNMMTQALMNSIESFK
jgi:proline iminopeptidase